MVIDYRPKTGNHVLSAIVPCCLIWFMCFSLAIPNLTLSTTVHGYDNRTMCTIVDLHFGHLLRNLLIVFRSFIPIPLLLFTFLINLTIVCKKTCVKDDITKLFHLTLQFILTYFIFCLQRNVLYLLHNLVSINDFVEDHFKFAPLENYLLNHHLNLYSCMLSYLEIVIKPVLCFMTLPFVRQGIKEMFTKKKEDK